jgi:hypothetical protein
MTAAFDLDAGGNVSVLVNGQLNRRGNSTDMVLLIPDSAFAGGGEFVYLYSKFSGASGGAESWSVGCRRHELPPSPPPPPPPPPAEGSSLSGRVWFDANQDGLVDVDEQGVPIDYGIAGVIVRLEGITLGGAAVTLETVTDANGNYTFTGLEAGDYIISEDQPLMPNGDFFGDGLDYLGSIEGADESTWGVVETPDRFALIQLGSNQNGVGYDFTELLSDNR